MGAKSCKSPKKSYIELLVNDLSLDLLKTFVSYAEADNMSEAAARLGVSQPAVTFQLKKLQESLKNPLFKQVGNKKSLTPYGRDLYENLKGKFQNIESIVNKVDNFHAEPERRLFKMAGRREVISRIVPRMNLVGTLELQNLGEAEVKDKLMQNQIDIAIVFEKISRSQIYHKELFSDHGVFCIHKKLLSPYLEKSGGSEEELKSLVKKKSFLLGIPAITYNRSLPYLKSWLGHHRVDLEDVNVRCYYEDWNVIVSLVEAGVGYSIIPSEVSIDTTDVVTLELSKKVIEPTTVYAAFHQEVGELGVIDRMFSGF